ncbi:coiled coil protein [Cryptosporidium ryanae]|uniref:coiled coil protein n=1 Tax=Cryptosporidium ryanae TaxID=515981 RepID=UPI00351A4680|nr:coiled coil protein [Cryptosporidium ryanae]
MSRISSILLFTLFLYGISQNECFESKPKPQGKTQRKPTKFDNQVLGDMKKKIDLSLEEEAAKREKKELKKNYNIKNTTFVKLWLSDLELRFGDSLFVSLDVETTFKPQTKFENEEEEINKIVEENRLVEKLKLLRQHEVVISGSGDAGSSGGVADVGALKSDSDEPTRDLILNLDLESFSSASFVTYNQEQAAMTILNGNNLIHNVNLVVDYGLLDSPRSDDLNDQVNDQYKDMTIDKCTELREKTIHKISVLKLEIANLNALANKLKAKNKTREYDNTIESIEKKTKILQESNCELRRIDKRINQLSSKDSELSISQGERSPEGSKTIEEPRAGTLAPAESANEAKVDAEKTSKEMAATEDSGEKSVEKTYSIDFEGIPQEQRANIERAAKMLVWLQENKGSKREDVSTRRERGRNALRNLVRIYKKDENKFQEVVQNIKNGFEKSVFESKIKSKSKL